MKSITWDTCIICSQVIMLPSNKSHRCPAIVKATYDAMIEGEIKDRMKNFDRDLKKLWNTKEAKFMKYLIDEGKI